MERRNALPARLRSQVLARATIAATAPEAVRVNSFTGALDLEWTTSGVPISAPPNYADGFRIAFRKAMRKVDHANQGVGLMIMFGDGAGHETAALFTAGQGRFLDPNVGEYSFDLASQLEQMVTFASSLWWRVYVRFYDFTAVRFERITCVDEDDAPPVIDI